MPFEGGDVRIDLACGRRADGHWHGWFAVRIRTEVLRRLGLHPDQPASRRLGPVQPGWWRAEAMRRFGARGKWMKLTWTTLSDPEGKGPRFGEPKPRPRPKPATTRPADPSP